MDKFTIVEQLTEAQIEELHALICSTWWAKQRSYEDIQTMLKTCMCFAVIEVSSQKLVAYARVLTDGIKYAYIFDVVAFEAYRGIGLGKKLMQTIIAHPQLSNIKNFELTCAPDMVPFYEHFGFSEDYGPEVRPMRYQRDQRQS